jgi:hypothetical protein
MQHKNYKKMMTVSNFYQKSKIKNQKSKIKNQNTKIKTQQEHIFLLL